MNTEIDDALPSGEMLGDLMLTNAQKRERDRLLKTGAPLSELRVFIEGLGLEWIEWVPLKQCEPAHCHHADSEGKR